MKGNNKGGKIEERLRDDVTGDGRYAWAVRLNDAVSEYCSARSAVARDVSTLRDDADADQGSAAEDGDGVDEFVVDDGGDSDDDDVLGESQSPRRVRRTRGRRVVRDPRARRGCGVRARRLTCRVKSASTSSAIAPRRFLSSSTTAITTQATMRR